MRAAEIGDLEDELAPHRPGEGLVVLGGDHEGAGATDQPVAELGLEILDRGDARCSRGRGSRDR